MFCPVHCRIIVGKAFKLINGYPLSTIGSVSCDNFRSFSVYLFIAGPQRVDESGKAREYPSGKHFITDLSSRMIHQ